MSSPDPTIHLPGLSEARKFLEQGDDFLVTSHINSDGDGVGGCLALQRMLQHMGKNAAVILHDIPEAYDFLEGWEDIQRPEEPPSVKARYTIVLDCPGLERIGDVQNYLDENTQILNIDHHKDDRFFGTTNLVSSDFSSSCELVYHLAVDAGLQIDAVVAAQLYVGILFDTGGFRFSLTTSTTFEVAADLVRSGARLDYIADQLFGNKSFESVKLIGKGIDSLELHCDDRVTSLHLGCEDMRNGDVEEVVNYGLLVKGVEVTLLLKEQEPEFYRISLRSRDRVDVSLIAAKFGGGGHAKASGCRRRGAAEQVRQELLDEVRKHLD